ncbi:hypothetical protein EI94DRAFT_1808386 [Lactarius quietus]|nr:hypothetical protein EI94DRAFT_1808386 [Lactarius quietus]
MPRLHSAITISGQLLGVEDNEVVINMDEHSYFGSEEVRVWTINFGFPSRHVPVTVWIPTSPPVASSGVESCPAPCAGAAFRPLTWSRGRLDLSRAHPPARPAARCLHARPPARPPTRTHALSCPQGLSARHVSSRMPSGPWGKHARTRNTLGFSRYRALHGALCSSRLVATAPGTKASHPATPASHAHSHSLWFLPPPSPSTIALALVALCLVRIGSSSSSPPPPPGVTRCAHILRPPCDSRLSARHVSSPLPLDEDVASGNARTPHAWPSTVILPLVSLAFALASSSSSSSSGVTRRAHILRPPCDSYSNRIPSTRAPAVAALSSSRLIGVGGWDRIEAKGCNAAHLGSPSGGSVRFSARTLASRC